MAYNSTGGPLYDYLIVIDFEATCDEGENPQITRANQEIIEFPWVVVDTIHGQVVDSKQVYVKPEWSKKLTPFCTQLTGITDDMLVNACYLREAVLQFDSYVYTNFINANKSFCIITDGNWDLKICLRQEAMTKGIKLAAHYSRFFDLRTEFAQLHKNAHAQTFVAMLSYLGIPLEGRHHSGYYDCVNISKIVSRMIKDGHRFQSPETIPDNFVPDANFKDFNRTNNNFALQQQYKQPQQQQYQQQPKQQNPYAQGPESCVRLRGLPWSATDSEIIRFFSPLHPTSVHLTVNFHGRATGEAFVEFGSENDANAALEYHRRMIGSRYVEVFKCSRADFARAANPTASQPVAGQGVVRMRGIPYSAAPSDISAFFAGFDIIPNGIHIVMGRDNRPSGEAYVQFSTDEHAEAAIKTKHREKIANRYIELFRSTKAELQHATSAPLSEYQASVDPNLNVNESVCVRMLGLPYSATAGDVINFFDGLQIVQGGVHFLNTGSNRPSGQGFAEFATVEDASRATERHKSMMGTRYIELFRCTKAEMLMELQNQAGLSAMMGMGGGMGSVGGMGGLGMGGIGGMGGMVGGMGPMGGMGGAGGFGMGGIGGMGLGMGGMGPSVGMNGPGGFNQQQIFELLQLVSANPTLFNGYAGGGGWAPHAQQPNHHHHNHHGGGGGGGGGFGRYAGGGNGRYDGGGGSGMSVKMRGLPYNASVGDIAQFFAGFDVVQNGIVLGGGADGRPSGEAWVQFGSHEEASRAIRTKNRQHMGSRYVELFPA